MNPAHLHLIINHLPIFLVLFSSGLLAYGVLKDAKTFTRLSLTLIIIASVLTYVTVESGENAEDLVEDIASVDHDTIEHHEEAGETASKIVYVLGVFAIIGLYSEYSNKSFKKPVHIVTLIIALVAGGFLIHTAYEGGMIRHPEAYSSEAVTGQTSAQENEQNEYDQD